jgi:hypothetical protein
MKTNMLSIKNSIYPIELEIKDTTATDTSASYLDLHLEIDNEGRLRTTPYDKRDDFNFPFANFPFICSNIPAAPVSHERGKDREVFATSGRYPW